MLYFVVNSCFGCYDLKSTEVGGYFGWFHHSHTNLSLGSFPLSAQSETPGTKQLSSALQSMPFAVGIFGTLHYSDIHTMLEGACWIV